MNDFIGKISHEEVGRATEALIAWQSEHADFVATFTGKKQRTISPEEMAVELKSRPLPEALFTFIFKVTYSRARVHAVQRGKADDQEFISSCQMDAINHCIRQCARFDPARGRLSTFITCAARSGMTRYVKRGKMQKRNGSVHNQQEFMEGIGRGARMGIFPSNKQDKFFLVSGDDPERQAEMNSIYRDAMERGELPEGWDDDDPPLRVRAKKSPP